MHDVSDLELLRNYNRQGSETAFAELVRRHINLVYAAALRHVGIAAHAEEITQVVFIILSRKAVGLRPDIVLEGWLYETTRLTSSSFLRGERRRQRREQEAYMQSTLPESSDSLIWKQLTPLLDEAMAQLGKKDRDAVILRFFKEKNLCEVAAAFNVTEAAAQSRVHRALEKLRKFYIRRGIALSAAAIAGAVATNSLQAAPTGLAKTISAGAVAKGALAGTSTLALLNGALKMMTWAKVKTAVAVGAVVLLAAGSSILVIKEASVYKKNIPPFTASGVVDTKFYSDGKLTEHLTNEFVCYVSGGRYSMFFTVSNPKDERTRSIECLFDGADTYFTRRFYTNPVTSFDTIKDGQITKHPLPRPVLPNNNAILEISNGSLPPTEDRAVTLVWLALGSIVDRAQVTAESQAPLAFMGMVYQDQHIKLKAASKIHNRAPGFLEWREDYHDGNVLSENNGHLLKTPLPGAWSSGYTNSSFSVVAWTNIMGWAFPQQAQLKFFMPLSSPGGSEFRNVCSVSVTSINLGSADTSFSPIVEPKTTIGEKRLTGIGANSTRYYLSEDGTILSPSELTGNHRYKVSSNQSAQLKKSLLNRHLFLILFTLIALGLPTLLICLNLPKILNVKKT
jgi:RNA polymerase sigma factor (sigma-70 family)